MVDLAVVGVGRGAEVAVQAVVGVARGVEVDRLVAENNNEVIVLFSLDDCEFVHCRIFAGPRCLKFSS